MPKTTPRFTRDAHISLTEEQYRFVMEELNGGMAHHIREMIDASRRYHDKELSELEKEFPQVEVTYLSMKKRIDELREERRQREEDQTLKQKRIEEARKSLLDELKRALWDPRRIQKAVYKFYADVTGQSVQEIIAWVEEQVKRRDELES